MKGLCETRHPVYPSRHDVACTMCILIAAAVFLLVLLGSSLLDSLMQQYGLAAESAKSAVPSPNSDEKRGGGKDALPQSCARRGCSSLRPSTQFVLPPKGNTKPCHPEAAPGASTFERRVPMTNGRCTKSPPPPHRARRRVAVRASWGTTKKREVVGKPPDAVQMPLARRRVLCVRSSGEGPGHPIDGPLWRVGTVRPRLQRFSKRAPFLQRQRGMKQRQAGGHRIRGY